MIEQEFDAATRAAYASSEAHPTLGNRIDDQLRRFRHARIVRRRLALSLAGAAAVAVFFMAAPAVQAEVALSKLEQALDGVTTVRMQSYTTTADGARYPSYAFLYDRGRWRFDRGPGNRSYYLDGQWYAFDDTLKVFTTMEKPDGPFSHGNGSFKVSSLVSQGMGNPLGRHAETEMTKLDGKDVKRISFENSSLPERYVFYADPKTDLPIRTEVEGKVLGKWVRVSEATFDYTPSSSTSDFAPELKQYPVISREQAEQRFTAAMTKQNLGGFLQRRGSVVVRTFDVAQDGTVFVVYQADVRTRNTWRGFGFDLTADDGTAYARPQVMDFSPSDAVPTDGRLEVDVFVPIEPYRSWHPRKYTLTATQDKRGDLVREIEMIITSPDGHSERSWSRNWNSSKLTEGKTVTVLSRDLDAPTCATRPAYMGQIAEGDFGNDAVSQMTKDAARASYYEGKQRWSDLLRWANAQLEDIHELAREGRGPYSENDVQTKLDEARKALDGRP